MRLFETLFWITNAVLFAWPHVVNLARLHLDELYFENNALGVLKAFKFNYRENGHPNMVFTKRKRKRDNFMFSSFKPDLDRYIIRSIELNLDSKLLYNCC